MPVVSRAIVGAVALLVVMTAVAQEAFRTKEPAQRGTQVRQSAGERDALAEYFADKLLLANRAEIELSKIAEERSTNPQVKQFAATLVRDHEKLNGEIAQLAPKAAASFAARLQRRTAETAERQTRTAAEEHSDGHAELTRLCQINHEACNIHSAMCKKMLEKYQGQDFDMAFLGMQIGAHSWLLSELKAIGNVGNSEFQALVAQASQSVEHHLTKAKELSQKLEDDRGQAKS